MMGVVCNHCGHKGGNIRFERCECGAWYCGFSCLVKSLNQVGINQHSFDDLDRCGCCAVEKLKAGKLIFPQGNKHLDRLLAPHLLVYAMGEVKAVKRKKKVSENQMSLF